MSTWASIQGRLVGVFAFGSKDFMDVATSVYTTDKIRVAMHCKHSDKNQQFYLSLEEAEELSSRLNKAIEVVQEDKKREVTAERRACRLP